MSHLPGRSRAHRVLAVASKGGHWHQLAMITPAFSSASVIYATTMPGLSEASGLGTAAVLPDFNRSALSGMWICIARLIQIVARERPTIVITTGAAPGLIALIIGRLYGAKTVWIDSVANAEQLSMSGKVASYVAHSCLTQWAHLQTGRIEYWGRLL